MDCSPPGSSVHGISQARKQEWVAISFFRDLPNPGIKPASPALSAVFFTTQPPGKPKQIVLGENNHQFMCGSWDKGCLFVVLGIVKNRAEN